MPLEPWLFCMELYFFDRNVQTCMRVVLCQTKNGLPSLLALSMKSLDALTNTSSKVVMSYFAFRNGKSCIFGTFDMSWGQRAFVDDPLLADSAPARHFHRIVRIGREAVDQAARPIRVVVRLVDGE